jgi:hypothetical protein
MAEAVGVTGTTLRSAWVKCRRIRPTMKMIMMTAWVVAE